CVAPEAMCARVVRCDRQPCGSGLHQARKEENPACALYLKPNPDVTTASPGKHTLESNPDSMAELPSDLHLVYHALQPYPADVPLEDVYAGLDLPTGDGTRPFVYVNMVQTFDGQTVLAGAAWTIGTDVDHRVRPAGVAVELVPATPDGEVDLMAVIRYLAGKRVRRVLCEGGPRFNVAVARAGLIDELFVTTALRLGGDPTAPRLFTAPVTDHPLQLVSEYHYRAPQGVREIYFRFRY